MPPSGPQATRANGLDEATPRTLCIDIGGTGLKAIVAGPTRTRGPPNT